MDPLTHWIKSHADTAVVLTALFGFFVWNGGQFSAVNDKLSEMDKRLTVIETVLMCKNIIPTQISRNEKS